MRMFKNCRFGFLTVAFITALILSTFGAVASADDSNKEAEKFFKAMSPEQLSDPVALDDFIRRFPDSEQARVAYTLRYGLLKKTPSIKDYNEFIAKCPYKDLSQLAIEEVYQLYKQQNTIVGFYDFIKRYPNTPQATVVMLRIQVLMFEYVCLLDEEEDYDAFISKFPDAPQVNEALKKAFDKALEKENGELKKFQNSDPKPTREDWINYVSEKVAKWEGEVDKFIQRNPDPDAPVNIDDQIELYRIKRMADVFLSATIKDSSKDIKVYVSYDLNARVSHKLEKLQFVKRCAKIQKTIETSHN